MIWFLGQKKYFWGILLSLVLVSVFLAHNLYKGFVLEEKLHVFHVLGDGILLTSAEGHVIVIDGGETSEILEKIHQILPFWRQEIDFLVVTHSDADHMTGALLVLDNFFVENTLSSGALSQSPLFGQWQQSMTQSRSGHLTSNPKKDYKLGNITLDVIWPGQSLWGQTPKNKNDTSVVIRAITRENSILLTGDLEKKGEQALLKTPTKIKSNILKVGHHGSKTSTIESFLAAVRPKNALISAHTNNRFGHPHPDVLSRIQAQSCTLVTKEVGDILVISNSSLPPSTCPQ